MRVPTGSSRRDRRDRSRSRQIRATTVLLAGPDAIIAGPTFAEWLETS